MRWHIIAVLLACVLFPSSIINAAKRLRAAERGDSSETSRAGHGESSHITFRVNEGQVVLLKKAKIATQKEAPVME